MDDGKSTLIGRLLVDTRSVLADTLSAVARTSRLRGLEASDLSLFTDGLAAEREQGITIDVAYRSFSTGARAFVLADAPGHEQYTRNMVTAASTSQLALLLVDATRGVQRQTLRHAVLAHQLGLRHLVVAVNKLDLVGWSAEAFARVRAEFEAAAARLGLPPAQLVPISALRGDMVVERGAHLGWWTGPTLLQLLEAAPTEAAEPGAPWRFPVQWVCRAAEGTPAAFRGLAGRVESGRVAVGDEVVVLPGGRPARVRALWRGQAPVEAAGAGESVLLQLDGEHDVARGDLLAHPASAPTPRREVEAVVCWLAERPLSPARRYLLRHTTLECRARPLEVSWRLDLEALARVPAGSLGLNDLGGVRWRLDQPLAVDAYASHRATGAFLVIDEATNDTVGGGMVE